MKGKNMNNNKWLSSIFVLLVYLLSGYQTVHAEGSFQVGLNQPLRDFAFTNERMFVDILSAGEVINVHVCGDIDANDIRVQIYNPADTEVLDISQNNGNVSCNDPFSAALTNPIQYTTTAAGTYAIELNNTGFTGDTNKIRRFDITVTQNNSSNPDPTVNGGRLWSNNWAFDTDSYAESAATNADFYPLVPGGRPNTSYVWKLDLNNFSGNVYDIIANDLGVDAPNSGLSTPTQANTATPKFPIYLSFPAVVKPRPTDPPVISSFRFIDDAGQDYAISPAVTNGVQDTGTFEFLSDIEGTYSIIIDINNDGVYDEKDFQLLGNAVLGSNQVTWDGKDAGGIIVATGTYSARLQLRLGEYHFVVEDVETSGGPNADGLTVFLANSNGSVTDTRVFWDDATLLGGTTTLPNGALSSTAAGKHTWGDFNTSGTGIGNQSFIDTYVYGLSSSDMALVAISTSDAPLFGDDGTITVIPPRSSPGDTLTSTVTDADLNLSTLVADSVVVRSVNNRSAEVEQITLTETGINTGIFTGTINTVPSGTAGTNNDGSMNSIAGDVITFTYQDQLDSSGNSVVRTALHFVGGVADTGTSTISASPASISANGTSSSTITVQLKDAGGNNLTTGGDSVVLSTTAGSLGSVTDNNNGTYTAILTSSTTIETATISGTLNGAGNTIADTASVSFTASAASAATSLITALPTSITADGTSTSTITVQLKDAGGNNLSTGGDTVVLSTTAGTLGNVIDNNDGTYTAILTSSAVVSVATISGTLNGAGNAITDTATVLFTVGTASAATTTITASPTSIAANGTSTSTITVQIKDASGNNLGTGGDTVVLSSTAGTLGPVIDNNNGTYTATLTSSTTAITATITGTLNGAGNAITDTATVAFTTGIASTATSTLTASPASISADGVSTSTVTVQLKDASGANLATGGDSVVLSATAGTLGAVTDNNNGTYTAILTSSTTVETATITGTLNGAGNTITDNATVAFTSTAASTVTSTLTANPGSIAADGVSTSTITVQLKDVAGNNLSAGGDSVVLSTTAGALGTLTDNNNGTYSATLTSSTMVETATISATLNGAANTIADTATVDFTNLIDTDGDGIPDVIETTDDKDNDGIPNNMDLDSDNDGVLDAVEGATDTDSDGIADFLDLDTDNDGIPDIREAGGSDSDGNGLVDNFIDTNSDGLDDAIAAAPLPDTDSDNDGNPDRKQLDSDNDGIKDLVEAGGSDTNNDGLVDGFSDVDLDGLDDTVASSPLPVYDSDQDGVPDYRDLDSDNDGLPDATEGMMDTDTDGVPDYRDLDSDNDGIPEILEVGASARDADGNGRIDNLVDSNGDGLDDIIAATPLSDTDTDNDTIPDRYELDSDNDGLLGLVEADGVDVNNDGLVDGFSDINGDGYDDMLSATPLIPPDDDNDGLLDFQDNDDRDGDGIPDSIDLDDDNDGVPDVVEGNNDTDNDGIPDSLELDSDNDGIPDISEAGGPDSNADGKVDNFVDNNNDGLDDNIAASPLPDLDSDNDGVPNRQDLDSDEDGIPDATEGLIDTDGDSVPDFRDLDSDNDAILDADEGTVDTDIDGVPDYRDLDSDNDGIPDITEIDGIDSDGDGKVDNFVDSNGDGLDDNIAASPLPDTDSDNDGIPDRHDLDSDNDEFNDLIEAGGTDSNNDSLVDNFTDTNGDGRDDAIAASPLTPPDSDSDGIEDFQEPFGTIKTGLDGAGGGGGCTVANHSRPDPLLPLFILVSMLYMFVRIKKAKGIQ
jgi:hypothetical protein